VVLGETVTEISPARAIAIDMDFPAAMQAVIQGERISKREWDSQYVYGEIRQGYLMIHKEDGWHRWVLSDGDLLGVDWFVV
jgi:hypothetical protein